LIAGSRIAAGEPFKWAVRDSALFFADALAGLLYICDIEHRHEIVSTCPEAFALRDGISHGTIVQVSYVTLVDNCKSARLGETGLRGNAPSPECCLSWRNPVQVRERGMAWFQTSLLPFI
jgi:hypothetical protein